MGSPASRGGRALAFTIKDDHILGGLYWGSPYLGKLPNANPRARNHEAGRPFEAGSLLPEPKPCIQHSDHNFISIPKPSEAVSLI